MYVCVCVCVGGGGGVGGGGSFYNANPYILFQTYKYL